MSRPTKAAKLASAGGGCADSNDLRSSWSRSCIFDPSLLLGNQALHELGPFLLVGLDPFVQQHLADLRYRPVFFISVGPGRWSGKSEKELVLAKPFLHPETERQATVDLMYSDSIHYTG
jgi:hypothetical protein